MSLNNKEIDLILEELNLEGWYIQKIIQPSYTALVLHMYKDRPLNVFISLEATACRLHSTKTKIPKFDKPMRFMELLKSRIKGCKIIKVEHINRDRIIRLTLSTAGGKYFLYVRLWSGAANIILTDENDTIIDAFYRRPRKGEVSGAKLTLPTPPEKQKEYEIREYDKSLSFNEAIEKWYIDKAPKISKEALLDEAENLYGAKIQKLEKNLSKLEKKREEFLHADTLKNAGDLLFSNLHLIKKGMTSIDLEDYTRGGEKINITLNPLKTPQENANAYYEKYKKAGSGLQALEDDMDAMRKQIEVLQEKLEKIKAEENPYVIQKIIQKERIPIQQKAKNTKTSPGLKFLCDGWSILVGRTSKENDELLRHFVKGNDLWLHVRDYAGGYVFVKAKAKKTIPLPILIKAGNLAVFYSKARKNAQADLYTTQVKHLRRAKGAPRGTVLPSNEKNLSIKLDPKILKELDEERIDIL